MTGRGILARLNKIKKGDQEKPGVLPLRAFYGRDPEAEFERGRMYRQMAEVMRLPETPRGHHFAAAEGISYVSDKSGLFIVNANSSPLEHLVAKGQMETREDEEGMGGARYHTALRFRELMDGAQVKTIRSPSLEGTGGGGAVSAGDIRGYQLDCMKLVERVKKGMSPWLFHILEAVVWRDDWIDIKGEPVSKTKMKERRKTIAALHYALDCAGVALGYLPEPEVTQRWPHGAPKMPPAVRRRILASMDGGRLSLQT